MFEEKTDVELDRHSEKVKQVQRYGGPHHGAPHWLPSVFQIGAKPLEWRPVSKCL